MKNLIIDWPAPGIAQLTLSQPKRRNALTAAMWQAIPDLLKELVKDKSLRVLIVTGNGDHFAAGADISEFETLYATAESSAKISANIQHACEALSAVPVPTIAMIRGACVGGGCGISLCCDLRFADSTAKFGITPAKLGLVYPFGDMSRLIDAVGVANASDILLSARIMGASEADKMGLVHRVVDVQALEEVVFDYAAGVSALSPESLRGMKSMISAYRNGQRQDTKRTREQFAAGFTSRDFSEGFRAFLEKRKPNFE